ncbi:MAG TPA: hypothetical protein VGL09_09310 [Methylomirabilota bacterium]|jgi:hypothetical protein
MRVIAGALLALLLATAPLRAADLVDAVVGEVEGRVATASDVALARALGLFGFTATNAAITPPDVDRLLDAWLVVAEAQRLGIGGGPDEVEAAWGTVAQRFGGAAALDAWLERVAVEAGRARAMVGDHSRWERFIEVRFREFAFVLPDDVTAALGAGVHSEAEQASARERLQAAETERRLAAWLADRRQRTTVQRVLYEGSTLPDPIPMPPGVAR